jgi:hypothetical protein
MQLSPEHSVIMYLRHASKTMDEGMDIEVRGKARKITETLEQLAWLSASLRPPSEDDSFSISHVEFRITAAPPEEKHILCEMFLLPLEHEQTTSPKLGSCWTPLFSKSVMAWGFPVCTRVEGIGIELPFHLLPTMAGVRYPVEFQGGIILRGKSETLFPVAKLASGAIQWHRVQGEDAQLFLDTVKSYPGWYQTKNLEELVESKTFLGFYSRAQVRLGTAASDVRPSEVPADRAWIRLGEEIPFNVTLRLPWIASFGVTPKIILPKSQWNRIENNRIGYKQSLQRSSHTPLLLYDSGTRTGWLVPELSVVLHLSLASLANMLPRPKSIKHLHYAKPRANGGGAALVAIDSCDQVVLWQKKEDDNKPYRFLDVVMHYMELFENRKQEQELRVRSGELSASIGLRGWDFANLRDNAYFFGPRELPAPRRSVPNWWDIGKDFRRLVIFGRNLGQVITPDRSKIRVCSAWETVPAQNELLVATVISLLDLCRDYQASLPAYRLTPDLVWHRPQTSTLFEGCAGLRCDPIQKVWATGALERIRKGFRHPRSPGNLEQEGAVIFGKRKAGLDHIRAHAPCTPLDLTAPEPWSVGITLPPSKMFNLVVPALVILTSLCLSYMWKLKLAVVDSRDLVPFANRTCA